jgi:hypothetical protein
MMQELLQLLKLDARVKSLLGGADPKVTSPFLWQSTGASGLVI